MKRKILVLALMAVVIAMSFCLSGCGKNENDPEIIETDISVYDDILNELYELIDSEGETYDAKEGEIGVWEAILTIGKDKAISRVGYTIEDISGDKTPELIIGAIKDASADNQIGSDIYAVYTYADGEVHCVLEGVYRSRYSYMGDGSFLYQGSSGVGYYIFGTYHISEDGMTLECNDYYFTYEEDETFTKFGYYHNTTGEFDKEAAEKLDITQDEFWQLEEDYIKEVKTIKLKPFSEYEYTGEGVDKDKTPAQVEAQWAEDGLEDYAEYDEFTADTYEPQSRILFTTDKSVKDFNVLALTPEDADDEGNITFSEESVYSLETLNPDRPLAVNLTFMGSIPGYGISYIDNDGSTKRFIVELSGKDGSLLMNEF